MRSSPRKKGNTNWLTDIVVDELRAVGCEVFEFDLFDMEIKPCTACRWCQKDWDSVSCIQKDDMQPIFDAILKSDVILLATPIYSWYCTPPMKAMLDRLVYAMNMYYGDERGPSIWAGKEVFPALRAEEGDGVVQTVRDRIVEDPEAVRFPVRGDVRVEDREGRGGIGLRREGDEHRPEGVVEQAVDPGPEELGHREPPFLPRELRRPRFDGIPGDPPEGFLVPLPRSPPGQPKDLVVLENAPDRSPAV